MRMIAAVLVICIAGPALADPRDWSTTFDTRALDSYLGGDDVKIVVVSTSASTRAATDAIQSALIESTRVTLIMDGMSLGPSADDDAAIAARAREFPLDVSIIVRAVTPDTVALDTYSLRSGESMYVRAEIGRPLVPATHPLAIAVHTLTEKERFFGERFIGFRRVRISSSHYEDLPFQGTKQRVLDDPLEFFRAVGQPGRVEHRVRARSALMWTGGTLGVVGVGAIAMVGYGELKMARQDPPPSPPSNAELGVILGGGLGGGLIGAALLGVGLKLKVRLPSLPEQHALAYRHNRELLAAAAAGEGK